MVWLNPYKRRENKYAKSSRGGPGQASADLCHHSLWSPLCSPPERRAQWLLRLSFPLRKQTGAAVQTRPRQRRGSSTTPGGSGLPPSPTWLAPGLALVPQPSLSRTNKQAALTQSGKSSEAGRAGATSTVRRGTWPNWICFITPYNDSQTGLFHCSKIKDYKKSACLPFRVWSKMGSSPKTDGEASQKCSLPLGTCGFPHHYITVNSWMSEIGDNNFQMLAAPANAGTCWMGTVIWQRGGSPRD